MGASPLRNAASDSNGSGCVRRNSYTSYESRRQRPTGGLPVEVPSLGAALKSTRRPGSRTGSD